MCQKYVYEIDFTTVYENYQKMSHLLLLRASKNIISN